MGWPTNIRIQPEHYRTIFEKDWAQLREWAQRELFVDKRDCSYRMGDLVPFLVAKSVERHDDFGGSFGQNDIVEWLELLSEHFDRYPADRAKLEEKLCKALKAKSKVTGIDLVIEPSRVWKSPKFQDVNGRLKITITTRRGQRRPRFRS